MSFDFATFKPQEILSKPATFKLIDPFKGETVAVFSVRSAHSQEMRNGQVERDKAIKAIDKQLKDKEITEDAADKQKEAIGIDYIASLIAGWEGELTVNGKALKYSEKNAVTLVSTSNWVQAQITQFALSFKNYGQDEKKS